jgi:hypothetical protein
MAWIEFNPDFGRLCDLLERLVEVAERALNEQYGFRYGHILTPPKDLDPNSKESVSYATDEETLAIRLKDLALQFRKEDSEEKMVTYGESE